MAAFSLLTSGKYVIDPELRGEEFERITQNLDLQFWKSFWNLTESGLISVRGKACQSHAKDKELTVCIVNVHAVSFY